MHRTELINKMKDLDLRWAWNLLQIRSNEETKEIFISDFDNVAYESGLASFLQDNAKWYNVKKGFKVILK